MSHKKFRDEHGVFIAEGPKIVEELLSSGKFICKILCALENSFNEHGIKNSAEQVFEINEIELEKVSLLQTPNKVLAVFYKKEDKLTDIKNNISLMLDEIQDPGNMGTIIRTADWFGIKNIICSPECVDHYNPKVVQASMGSIARVNILYTGLSNFINNNSAVAVYAAVLQGTNVFSLGEIKEGIIIIGNESKGIKENLLNLSLKQITIPKYGEAESLNAAVACGIILSKLVYGNTL
ncbi:MAG: RNA methyltransferase [Bacteroidota bacterium]|nr:RNA methyltransferase [Bacteroidota bacterium]